MSEHLEGRQSVLAALRARQRRFEVILLRHGIHTEPLRDMLDLAAELGVPVRHVAGEELSRLAHGATHGGVIAVASAKPRLNFDELLASLHHVVNPLLLLLEGVDDARNLGFTLRTADAVGVHAVMIKKHLWDFDPVEVARPSAGAYERITLVQIDDVEPLLQLKKAGIQIVGCVAAARRSVFDVDLRRGTLLCVGGEKRGLSGAVRNHCDVFAAIPTGGGSEGSLSLSHAAAILLGETLRQRRPPGPLSTGDSLPADDGGE